MLAEIASYSVCASIMTLAYLLFAEKSTKGLRFISQ